MLQGKYRGKEAHFDSFDDFFNNFTIQSSRSRIKQYISHEDQHAIYIKLWDYYWIFIIFLCLLSYKNKFFQSLLLLILLLYIFQIYFLFQYKI